jgi:hypothetical protein
VNDWFPIGDSAQLYLRAADVGTSNHPLLGAWSSASISLGTDLNNPGPIYADLIAPFAHVFSPGVGNVIGVTLINIACFIGAVIAAHRIGGWRFERIIILAGSALAWMIGSELLFDMFQAHALMFPFLAGLVLMVGAIDGQTWVWPWLVVVLSVILQTHISYAYIVSLMLIGVVTVITAQIPARRRQALYAARRSRPLMISATIFLILWTQPLIEQLFGEGEGNISRLANAADGADFVVGAKNAIRLVASIVSLPPWWSRSGFADTIEPAGIGDHGTLSIPGLQGGLVSLTALGATFLVLGWCWWFARSRADGVLKAASAVSLIGLTCSLVALGRLTVGPVGLAPHHTRWLFVLSLFIHIVIVWSGWIYLRGFASRRLAASDHSPLPLGRATAVVVAGVAVFAAMNIPKYAQQHGPTDDVHTMPAMRQLFDDLDRLADLEPILYRTDNVRVFEPYSSAFHLQLRHRGIEFRVESESLLRHLGAGRRADGTERVTLSQHERWEAVGGDLPGCLLGRASMFDATDHTRFEADARELATRTALFDVSAVQTGSTNEVDTALATRFLDGDTSAIREVTYDGRLVGWIDSGWVTGNEATIEELRAMAPRLVEWLDSVVALVVSPADVCE